MVDVGLGSLAVAIAGVLVLVIFVAVRYGRLKAEAALHLSEDRYRLAFQATRDVILDAELSHDTVVFSPRTREVFGFDPEEMGATLAEWVTTKIHPDDLPIVRKTFARTRKQGGSFRVECRHLCADGSYADIVSHGWIVHDENGQATRTVGAIADVTQRKRAEQELRETGDAALEAARAKSAFLATMSHEIRTPMNGVIGMTGLLLETDLTPRQQEYAHAARRSGETLLALINDILDFSKIESGRQELEITVLDVREAVEDVVTLLADQAQRKGLEIAARVPPDLPPALLGDPARLRQILTNLVGNAVKFTERGEVIVRVAVIEQGPDTVQLRFEVSDTGIGIPSDAQARMFQPFSQADSSTTRRYGGTGLGLAICKYLVQLMGGEIGFDTRLGEGTTFWFTIQVATVPDASAAARPPMDLHGLRVVAVDDNATNRLILQDQLAAWNMQVWTASDGASALQVVGRMLAEGAPPDLVLLDMHMPAMDGLQLARALRADAGLARTRLLLLTSLGQGALASGVTAAAGIAKALTKPVRQSVLFDTIARTMRGADPVVQKSECAPALPRHGPGPRVLVAEDTEVNQEVARGMLEKLGYLADVVGNGREAIDMLRQSRYAVVLMDVQMPEMDGFEATEVIRREDAAAGVPRVPIIALTANAMSGDRERCLEAGMDDYLSKPMRMHELAAVLARWAPRVEQNLLDATALEELQALGVPGGPNPVARMVELFIVDSQRRLERLNDAIQRQDAAEVQRLAHAQKGSSGTIGAREVGALAAELDELARGENLDGAADLFKALQAAFGRTQRALEPYHRTRAA
jgi:two-component system sensor histidine kinase/response regulator